MKSGYLQVLVVAFAFGAGLVSMDIMNKTSESDQDMNDRIVADTAKCVSAGLEPEIEERYSTFGSGDQFFVVCKPPGGKGSNLDRLMRQYKGVESRKPEHPESFETKSKRTE